MSGDGARLQSSSEEARYRAVLDLDPSSDGGLASLMAALDDPCWRVQAAATERLASARDARRVVPSLVAALGPDSPPARRGAAASTLVRIGAAAVPAVGEALASRAAETRTAAADVLGQIADRRATPLLASRLSDPDANARVAAAEALGRIGGEPAVAALRLAVQVCGDAPLQLAAIDSLARLRAPPSAARLREIASDRLLRRSALRLAGCSDDPGAIGVLFDGLREGPRGPRDAALVALGEVRLRRGRGALDLVGRELAAAVDADPSLRAAVAAALASTRAAACVGALAVLEHAATPQDAVAVARAAEHEIARALVPDVLESIGRAAADPLLAALPGLAPPARAAVLEALARLGDRRVLVEICADVASQDEAARAAAVDAVGTLGAPEAIAPLVDLLDYPDPGVSGAAASALARLAASNGAAHLSILEACRPASGLSPARCRLVGRIGDAGDVAVLRRAMGAQDPTLRIAALSAVGELTSRGVASTAHLPEVLTALEDASPAVRAAAARALAADAGRWPEAIIALANALRDPEAAVRAAAALALGKARSREHAPRLAALAGDAAAPPEVAAAAVRALADMGAADAAVIERAARHPDSEVVKEAVAAAAAIPGPAGASLLLTTAAHPRWDVRRAAAHALGRRGERMLLDAARRLAASEDDSLVAEALAEAIRTLEAVH